MFKIYVAIVRFKGNKMKSTRLPSIENNPGVKQANQLLIKRLINARGQIDHKEPKSLAFSPCQVNTKRFQLEEGIFMSII